MSERILIHFSPEPIKKFENKPSIRRLKNDKPEGLWYSYNDIWLQFCKLNPNKTNNIDIKWVYFFSLKNDNFTTDINDISTDKIIVINSTNYKEFIEKYMLMPNKNDNKIPIYQEYTKWNAFWKNVKEDWGGIEFADKSIFDEEYIIIPDISNVDRTVQTESTKTNITYKKQYLKLKVNKLFKALDIVSGCIFNPLTFNGGLSLNKQDNKIFVKTAKITDCNLSRLLSKLYTPEDIFLSSNITSIKTDSKSDNNTIDNSKKNIKTNSSEYEDIILKTLSSDEYAMGDLQFRMLEKMEKDEEERRLKRLKKLRNKRLLHKLNKSLKKYIENKNKYGLLYRRTKKFNK
jgi:hypothetical protein